MSAGLTVLLSAALGIVLLTSAMPKPRNPKGFVLSVMEYRVLPPRLSSWYGHVVPPVELLLALLLLTGTAVRSAAAIMSLLLLSFAAAIATNMVRGRDLDCHCFGGARRRLIGWRLLFQDAALIAAAAGLAIVSSQLVGPEPWSPLRLFGWLQAGSPWALVGCAAAAVGGMALLGGQARAVRARWV